jgi:hypothetical protein
LWLVKLAGFCFMRGRVVSRFVAILAADSHGALPSWICVVPVISRGNKIGIFRAL